MVNGAGVGARRASDAGSSFMELRRRREDEPASRSCFPLRPWFQNPMAARRPAGELEDGERLGFGRVGFLGGSGLEVGSVDDDRSTASPFKKDDERAPGRMTGEAGRPCALMLAGGR